jgi:plasmid maintenance system antidote protein VapI
MNEHIKTAMSAARTFVEASEALDQAKEALKPLANQQIEITQKVAIKLGLKDSYDYRAMFYYDWFEIGCYYEGASDTPVINVNLWYRGRGDIDIDTVGGSFKLSQHIINGQPELFEEQLRTKLNVQATKKLQAEREQKQRQIEQLQAQLDKMKGQI